MLIHVHRAKQESKTKLHGRYIRSVVVLRFHSFRFLNMCDDGLLSGEERERERERRMHTRTHTHTYTHTHTHTHVQIHTHTYTHTLT